MTRIARSANAILGRKPGGDDALHRLLRVEDLPGPGWVRLDDRVWPTWERDTSAGWAHRTKGGHSLTAWRSFEQDAGARWFWVEVTPLIDGGDARSALPLIAGRMVGNSAPRAEVIREEDAAPPGVTGAEAVWAHEQESLGPRGRDQAFLLACVTDATVVAVAANGAAGSWDWPAVVALTEVQLSRLKRTAAPS